MIIVSKFNILHSFGGAYTMSNLDDEKYINLVYLGKCVEATNQKMERDRMFEDGKRSVYTQ